MTVWVDFGSTKNANSVFSGGRSLADSVWAFDLNSKNSTVPSEVPLFIILVEVVLLGFALFFARKRNLNNSMAARLSRAFLFFSAFLQLFLRLVEKFRGKLVWDLRGIADDAPWYVICMAYSLLLVDLLFSFAAQNENIAINAKVSRGHWRAVGTVLSSQLLLVLLPCFILRTLQIGGRACNNMLVLGYICLTMLLLNAGFAVSFWKVWAIRMRSRKFKLNLHSLSASPSSFVSTPCTDCTSASNANESAEVNCGQSFSPTKRDISPSLMFADFSTSTVSPNCGSFPFSPNSQILSFTEFFKNSCGESSLMLVVLFVLSATSLLAVVLTLKVFQFFSSYDFYSAIQGNSSRFHGAFPSIDPEFDVVASSSFEALLTLVFSRVSNSQSIIRLFLSLMFASIGRSPMSIAEVGKLDTHFKPMTVSSKT